MANTKTVVNKILGDKKNSTSTSIVTNTIGKNLSLPKRSTYKLDRLQVTKENLNEYKK